MMASFEKKLPLEQWQQILANVSHGDLCNMVLTSRHMYSVASWPHMWAGMRVNMWKVKDEGLAQLYAINRFKNVGKYMSFDGMRLTTLELERVLNDIPASPVQSLNLEWNKLSDVSAGLLARAVKSLTSVNLNNTNLTRQQCDNLLEASISSTTLAHLYLSHAPLSIVPSNLLASAIKSLTSVNLARALVTTEQCTKLLWDSLDSTTLDHLDLSGVDLSGVSPDLLIGAAKRLTTINLKLINLTREQCNKAREASLSSIQLADLVSFGVFDARIMSTVN